MPKSTGEVGPSAGGRAPFSDDVVAGLRDYWRVYDEQFEALDAALLASLQKSPAFSPLLQAMPKEARSAQSRAARERTRRAIFDGAWEPYEQGLRTEGATFARLGASFRDWFDLMSTASNDMVPRLVAAYGSDHPRMIAAVRAMQAMASRAMMLIGEEYLGAKERALLEQERTAREAASEELRVALRDRDFVDGLSGPFANHTDIASLFQDWADRAGSYFQCSRAFVAELDGSTQQVRFSEGYHPDAPSLAGDHPRSVFSAESLKLSAAGTVTVNNDTRTDPRTASQSAGYEARGLRATVAVPVFRNGEWAASFVLASATPRVWTTREINLVQLLAERTWSLAEQLRILSILRAAKVVGGNGSTPGSANGDLQKFKTTLDRTMDAIFMFEPNELRFVYANQGAVAQLGYSVGELLQMTPLDLNPDLSEADLRRRLAPLIAGDAPVATYESVNRAKEGRDIPVEIVLQYLAPANEPPRCVAIVRDITERRRVDQLKSEFVSMVSHELRTPLTSIRGSLGLVARGITGPLSAQAQEYVDIALANCERLVRLINDILDIEKIQSGSIELRLQLVELVSVIKKTVAANEAFAASHGTTFAFTRELPGLEVLVDEDRLMQVLTNLLSNAAKFSPAGQPVELSMVVRGARLRVNVRDHGTGIPDEFRSRIFQRFAQADSSDTRKKAGTGLGLSISKALVEGMRGELGFEAAEGGGTIFWVDLPWLPAAAAGLSGDALEKRVLVCEDDLDIARQIARLVEQAGGGADLAPTLERARKLLASHRFRLVTLDLLLADGEGLVLVPEIRRSATNSNVPIVVVSGSRSGKLDLRGMVAVADILRKPIDEPRLLETIRSSLVRAPGHGHARILHVEDDADVRKIVRKLLPEEWEVVGAETVASAKALLAASPFDLVLLDLSLPDGSGEALLPLAGDAEVVIFSAMETGPALAQRVSRALVKGRASETHLRDVILALMEKQAPARSPP